MRFIKNIAAYMLMVMVLTCFTCELRADASSVSSSEYLLKAAFIYKFINFVDWPENAINNSKFNLCLYDGNPFGDAIFVFNGKKIRDMTVQVRIIKDISRAENCNLLYIPPERKAQLSVILGKLKSKAVLTVSDFKGFSKKGGMINLLKVSNRIRFEINLSSAKRAGLKISSKLLRLAVRVYDDKKVSVRRGVKESFN